MQVYRLVTLELVRSFSLAHPCRGIAVNAEGQVFGAYWDGYLRRFKVGRDRKIDVL